MAVPLRLLLGIASLYGQVAPPSPVPQINQPLVPMSIAPGGAAFTLTVNGTGFVSTSEVYWDGSAWATTFVNSTQLTAGLDVDDIANADTAFVTVVSPAPGGGVCNLAFFHIIDPFSPVAFGRSVLATGARPTSVITGNFNGDGKLDVATANFSGSTVSRRKTFLQIQLNRFAPNLKWMGVNVRVDRPPRRPPRGAGLLPLPFNLAYTVHR